MKILEFEDDEGNEDFVNLFVRMFSGARIAFEKDSSVLTIRTVERESGFIQSFCFEFKSNQGAWEALEKITKWLTTDGADMFMTMPGEYTYIDSFRERAQALREALPRGQGEEEEEEEEEDKE